MAVNWEFTVDDIKVSEILSNFITDAIPDELCNVGTSNRWYTNYCLKSECTQDSLNDTQVRLGGNIHLKMPVNTFDECRLFSTCILTSNTSTAVSNTFNPHEASTVYRLIDFNPQNYYIEYSNYNRGFARGLCGLLKKLSDDSTVSVDGKSIFIMPLILYPTGSGIYMYPYRPINSTVDIYNVCNSIYDKTYTSFMHQIACGFESNDGNRISVFPSELDVTFTHPTPPENTDDYNFSCGSISNRANFGITFNYDAKELLSCMGYYFAYESVKYMPIIKNNVTDGTYVLYADKDNYESDIKDRTSTIDGKPNFKPDKPIEDDVDNMDIGYFGAVSGFTRFYEIDYNNLVTLVQAIQSDDVPAGKTFDKSIICVNKYPRDIKGLIYPVTPQTDIIINGFNTTAKGTLITNQIKYMCDFTVDIPRINKNFLDFSPYTQYELYVPFCNWVVLPDKVAGKTIRVNLLFDIVSMSCKAVISCVLNGNNCVIATVTGCIGTTQPLSVEAVGLKEASTTQSMLSVGAGLLSTGGALATNNIIGAIGGVASVIGAISQGNIANNNNYTHQIGAIGDTTNFGLMRKCWYKISSPVTQIPANYNHIYGRPLNKNKTLSSVHGFTTCDNVDITGLSCTAHEKTIIKQYLETGVYL